MVPRAKAYRWQKIAEWKRKKGIKSRPSRERWQDLRFKTWVRDKYCCVHCGSHVSFRKAHIDHIVPLAKGGGNSMANLRCLCVYCHSLRADPTHLKLRIKSLKKGIIPEDFASLLWE